jgi:hypothetical protein
MTNLLTEAKVPIISLQQARDNNFFGPVYHGTSAEKRDKIAMDGFRIPIGTERSGDVSHGYETSDYSGGIPAPIHHLGFGVYFTTVLSIAKSYSDGTLRGMPVYYLNAPRMAKINWGSPRTMMKWWLENGYDYKITPDTTFGGYRTEWGGTRNTLPSIRQERLRATIHMTDELKSQYDAVWYKGKGMHRLLDGDQVVVFDPSLIYQVDPKLSKGLEIGAKVRAKRRIEHLNYAGEVYKTVEDGDTGIIIAKQDVSQARQLYTNHWAKRADKYVLDVKFKKSGRQQVEDVDVEPLTQ